MNWFRSRKRALRKVQERATRGAELLDKKRPCWTAEIDRKGLDMQSLCDCVLGQLYGSYDAGLSALWPQTNWPQINANASHLGLNTTDGASTKAQGVHYATLRKAWLELIEERLAVSV